MISVRYGGRKRIQVLPRGLASNIQVPIPALPSSLPNEMRQSKVLPGLATFGLMVSFLLGAKAERLPAHLPSRGQVASGQSIEDWWNGNYGSGNWFGARDTLENEGLTLRVEWKAISLWN